MDGKYIMIPMMPRVDTREWVCKEPGRGVAINIMIIYTYIIL